MAYRNQFRSLASSFSGSLVALGLILTPLFQSCATTLSGQLKDPQGRAISSSEARVNIMPLSDKSARGFVLPVEDDGSFSTNEEIKPGSYLVEALVPGFRVSSEKVEISGSKDVKLTVTPLGKTKTQAVGANQDVDSAKGGGQATLTPPEL